MEDGESGGTAKAGVANPSKMSNNGKKHLSYNFRGQKVMKQIRLGVDKQLVKKSMLLFEADTSSVDYLKDVLVQSAKKHQLDQQERDQKPPSAKRKDRKGPKDVRQKKGDASASPKQQRRKGATKKANDDDDNNNNAKMGATPKSTKKGKLLRKKKKIKDKTKTTTTTEHNEHQKRSDAAREKLNASLSSLQSLIGLDSDVNNTGHGSPQQQHSPVDNSISAPEDTNVATLDVVGFKHEVDEVCVQNQNNDDRFIITSNTWLQEQQSLEQTTVAPPADAASVYSEVGSTSINKSDQHLPEPNFSSQSQHSTVTAEECRQVARDALTEASTHTQLNNDAEEEEVTSTEQRGVGCTASVDATRAFESDRDIEKPPHWTRSQAEFVDVKRALWRFLDAENQCPESMTRPLQEKYGIDHEDIELAVEHIRFAQMYNNGIRWDLIGSLFFPDSSNYPDDDVKKEEFPKPNNEHQIEQSDDFGLEYEESLADISTGLMTAMKEEGLKDGEDDSPLSLREQYQEVILDIYEAMEGVLNDLPPKEAAVRQQALIHLLRATSEDEAYLTSLSLDDLHEIISHFELCLEYGIGALQWSMVEEIVFPLGPNEYESSSSGRGIDLRDEELDVVLNHINLASMRGEEIRWDLVAEVLFPCDPVFQKILGGNSSIKNVSTGTAVAKNNFVESKYNNSTTSPDKAAKERARAVLSLSNHDMEIVDADDYESDDCSGDYDSFCEISVDSME